MDITQYEFEIKRHAFIRAMQRGITPDIIEIDNSISRMPKMQSIFVHD